MIQINIKDSLYPESLKNISNSPNSLYIEGNTTLLNSHSIAIIGSRNCSENGIKIANYFSSELSMSGITIVSGLAKGIDTAAHLSSYNQKGKTIAVLGSGFNKIFPPENIQLYEKILNNDGLVISEYAPNEEPKSSNFIERNRIISGLSLGVLVIEAKYRSGTSTTAKIAKCQGKSVFAVPHEIWDSHGIGTNRLLKKDAILVTSPLDILEALKLNNFKNSYLQLKQKDYFHQNSSDNKKITLPDIKQSTIYNLISKNPISVNDLSIKSGYSIKEVQSILFMLELDGYIKKIGGNYICT